MTNQELINKLLDCHYDFLLGNIDKDVKDMYFKRITEYEDLSNCNRSYCML